MKQYFTDEKTGITYTLQGDYYLPNFALLAEEQEEVGLWGQKHLRYLKQNRKVIYYNLVTSEKLNSYLADINEQAESIFLRLVKERAEKENVAFVHCKKPHFASKMANTQVRFFFVTVLLSFSCSQFLHCLSINFISNMIVLCRFEN